jgi:FkbM family methyltransferase
MIVPPFPSFNCQKACRYGQLLYNANDKYVGRSFDLYGEFSEGESDLFRQLVRPGHTVVEVGANLGAHTLLLAQLAGPSGRVLAFEPQRLVFQALCANMALNSITNAHCFHQAAGAEPGELLVPVLDPLRTNNFGGLALGGHRQGERVPVVPLDDLNLDLCDILKIDAEGMEGDVLRGARRMIARLAPTLYVENDRAERSDALIRAIDALGYDQYWHLPPLFNPDNFFGNPENVFGRIVSRNMLCVPRRRPFKIVGFEPVRVPAATPG